MPRPRKYATEDTPISMPIYIKIRLQDYGTLFDHYEKPEIDRLVLDFLTTLAKELREKFPTEE